MDPSSWILTFPRDKQRRKAACCSTPEGTQQRMVSPQKPSPKGLKSRARRQAAATRKARPSGERTGPFFLARGRVPHLTRRVHSHLDAKGRRSFPIPPKSVSSSWMPPPRALTPSGPPRQESLGPYLVRARAQPSRDWATSRLRSLEPGAR